MVEFLSNLFMGVVSGLVTALLLFVWYVLIKHAINPWWENRLYKGVVLSGTWRGRRVAHHKIKEKNEEDEPTNTIHEELNIQMELEQSGYNLKGIFTAESLMADKSRKEKYTNIYKIKGHVHDNYVTLEYHPLSPKRTGMGTFLMEVKNGGKNLRGNITFLEEEDMEIVTLEDALLNREGAD